VKGGWRDTDREEGEEVGGKRFQWSTQALREGKRKGRGREKTNERRGREEGSKQQIQGFRMYLSSGCI
jgi:hypothetical protein